MLHIGEYVLVLIAAVIVPALCAQHTPFPKRYKATALLGLLCSER
jgi:hypothetical protein